MYPDLVICGAPRCGTTSLYTYLGAHPDVGITRVKETHFFLGADHPLALPVHCDNAGDEAYAAYFEHCGDARLRVGDDPYFLFCERALERVLALPSRPRLLLILRNPVDRLHSFFRYSQNNRVELPPGYDFDIYVDQLINGAFERRYGERFPLEAAALQHGRYVRFLEPLWREARDRIIVAFFEDMARDPRRFMTSLATQLQIAPDFYDDYAFEIKNSSLQVKSRRLHKIASKVQRWISPNVDPFAASWPGRDWLVGLYKSLNTGGNRVPSLAEDTQQRLADFYAPDNDALFDLLAVPKVPEWAV